MKLAVITAYPPSPRPHSSFALAAVNRFLESPDVTQVIVLADTITHTHQVELSSRLVIDRCWRYGSLLVLPQLLLAVLKYKPDVVWISLHYTHFASTPLAMMTSLLLPFCLRVLRIPVTVLLHNFLGAVQPAQMGIRTYGMVTQAADAVVMKSITNADVVFTMLASHYERLSNKYPKAHLALVQQDLYRPKALAAPNPHTKRIFTIGYYGTHKRLDVLLDAFQLTKAALPDCELVIAGISHCLTPSYLEELPSVYDNKLIDVMFLGFVAEDDLDTYLEASNIVVLTTVADVGSSASLRLAAKSGRGVIAPSIGDFASLDPKEWGVIHYEPSNSTELAARLYEVLSQPELQRQLGQRNLMRIAATADTFVSQHLEVFKQLVN